LTAEPVVYCFVGGAEHYLGGNTNTVRDVTEPWV